MKIQALPTNRARQMSGFTLIEMIGVLAVIAILAAVLIPKVFEAINNARVNNAAMGINTVKTACIDHYAKFGSFPVDGSAGGTPVALTTAQQAAFDGVLLHEGFLDKPFSVKIGDGSSTNAIRIVAASASTIQADGSTPGVYDLDGDNGTATAKNDAAGTWVVEAVLSGVQEADAIALNRAIDGTSPALGAATAGAKDVGGRVEYAAPSGGLCEVHVYLTHR